MRRENITVKVCVDTSYPIDTIEKMGQLISDLTKKNRELYEHNQRLIACLEERIDV